MEEILKKNSLLELAERMLRLRYSLDANHLELVFQEISVGDYIILARLARRMGFHEPETRVYLSEISKEMEISIQKASAMAQNLQNKGYIYWEHDKRGTYIYISEIGREVMKKQQLVLETLFGNVVERLGTETFIQILDQMTLIEKVMEEEAEKLA